MTCSIRMRRWRWTMQVLCLTGAAAMLTACGSEPERAELPPPEPMTAMNEPAPANEGPLMEVGPTEPLPEPAPQAQPEPQWVDSNMPAQPAASTHRVVRGDTLWSLAERYYGDGKRWRDIAQANGITNERRLIVGTELVIP